MKKALSVFLSCILLLSVAIVAVPATATTDTAPIEATPIIDWTNSTAMSATAVNSTTQPLSWTIAQGISMLPSSTYETTGYQATNLSSSAAYAWAQMNEYFTTNATHFLMYVKLDDANTILPSVGIDLNFGYFPAMTLAGGKDYSYVEIDGTEWQDGTSDSNGAIKFDSAFEGYIKFKLTDLSGESGTVGFNSTRKVSEIRCRLEGLGGDYGNAVVGPFFLVTSDSTSTEINIADDYKPQPIEATPLVDWTRNGNAYATAVTTEYAPLIWTTAQGISMTPASTYSTTGYQAGVTDETTIAGSKAWLGVKWADTITFGDATAFMFYVKVDGENTVVPKFWKNSNYSSSFNLKVGATYSYLAKDSTEWKTDKQTVNSGDATGNGGIYFEDEFEGYVKFDLSAFSSTPTSTSTIYELRCHWEGIGGTFGNVVMGPFFFITKDSTSTEINIDDAYKTKPIDATPMTDWSNYGVGNWEKVNADGREMPLSYTTAEGVVFTHYSNAQPIENDEHIRFYIDFSETKVLEKMIVYVNFKSANKLKIVLSSSSGAPWNELSAKTKYKFAKIGDETWEDGEVNSSSQIEFDKPFEGYLKFDISDNFGNSGFSRILFYLQGVGTGTTAAGNEVTYGTPVIGPIFDVQTDSVLTEINVPEEYKPQPIKVTTMNDWALRGYSYLYSSSKIATPFDWTSAQGVELTPSASLKTDGAYVFGNSLDYNGDPIKDASGNLIDETVLGLRSSKAFSCVTLTNAVAVTDVTDIIMYVKTDKKNTILPVFSMDLNNGTSAVREMSLIPGTDYYIAELDAQEWTKVEGGVEYCGAVGGDENTGGGISFNGAFEGYIKFDINNLRASDKLFSSDYLIYEIRCFVKGIGGDYSSSIITGPYFTTTADSTSTEIEMNEIDGDIDFDAVLTLNDVTLLRQHLLGTANAFVTKYGNANGDTDGLIDICDLVYVNEKYEQVVFSKFFDTKEEVTDYAYSFAVVGDTQHVARSHTSEMSKIYDWILANQESKKIQHVFGLGDITDGDNDFEWEAAQEAINKMNGVLPYSLVRGNHDSVAQFEKYFATDAYKSQFGGTFYSDDDEADEGEITNSYKTFEVDGTKYLFLTLDYLSDTDKGGDNPGQPLSAEEQDEIIAWAKGVIDAHSEYKVIISTHNYLKDTNKIANDNDIETEIVAKCPNVFLVLGGHYESEKIVCNQTDYTTHKVTSLLINPQSLDIRYNGGTGLVAMLYFKNDGTIEVEYYSTIREQFFMEENQFTITVE